MATGTGLLMEIAFGQEADAMRADPVVSCLAALVGGVRAVLRGQTPDDRDTRDLLEVACVSELDPYALHLAFRIDRLRQLDLQAAPRPPDLFALGRAHAFARLQLLTPGVRQLLLHATVRALDPEPHRAGWAPLALRDLPRLSASDLPPDPARFPHLADLLATPPTAPPAGWVPPWERPLSSGS